MSATVGQQMADLPQPGALKLEARIQSSAGVRSENQDTAANYLMRDGVCGIVADGMGGGVDGQLFSQQAVEQVIRALDGSAAAALAERIAQALHAAVAGIYALRASDPRYQHSGSTLALAGVVVDTDHAEAIIAHIGDSRVYQITGDGTATLLTRDHNYAESLIAEGMDQEQAFLHPLAQRLTFSLGEDLVLDRIPDISSTTRLQPDDRLLICSDGVSRVLQPHELATATIGRSAQDAVDLIVQRALEKGSRDNVTALIIHCLGTTAVQWSRSPRLLAARSRRRTTTLIAFGLLCVALVAIGVFAWQANARIAIPTATLTAAPPGITAPVLIVATPSAGATKMPTSTTAPTPTPTPTATPTPTSTPTPTRTPRPPTPRPPATAKPAATAVDPGVLPTVSVEPSPAEAPTTEPPPTAEAPPPTTEASPPTEPPPTTEPPTTEPPPTP